MSLIPRLLALSLVISSALCGAQETPEEILSPDGKFVFQFVEPKEDAGFGRWRITEKATGQAVWQSPEEANETWVRGARCIWSSDSKEFALNYQAGARYEVTRIYHHEGDTFAALPSFEPLLAAQLDKIKNQQLRELAEKCPPEFLHRRAVLEGSFQRRLWDQFRVCRWIDNRTLEVAAYSIRHMTTPDRRLDDEELAASMRFVVRQDRNKWKIIEEKVVPIEQMQ